MEIKNNLKTAVLLCTCDANKYISEYINHYKNLHFSNIILVDNSKDENIFDVISNDDEFIIYEDYKNKDFNHTGFVKEIFCKYYTSFDYIAIFDIDEFLFLNEKYENDINNYLNEPFAKNHDQILIHWKIFGSNNQTYYENKPVIERFTKSSDWGNWQIKSIINCNNVKAKLTITEIFDSIFEHGIPDNKLLNCLDDGSDIPKYKVIIWDPKYKCATLNHYINKSLEEFCENKRITKNSIAKYHKYTCNGTLWQFYLNNDKTFTEEQLNYIEKLILE